jgi:hypothetical protein
LSTRADGDAPFVATTVDDRLQNQAHQYLGSGAYLLMDKDRCFQPSCAKDRV